MADALGHRVYFTSIVGKGTVFHLELPLLANAAPEPPSAIELERPPGYGLFGTKVLLVENDESVQEAMRTLLERWCCSVRTAASTGEAIDALNDTDWMPDIIIADQHLEHGDLGTETIGGARHYLGRIIPALIITADPSEAIAQAARAQNIEMMRKPVKPAQLRALLAHLLA